MTNALFVYGTLKRGEVNGNLLLPHVESVEQASMQGDLYDLGLFPVLVAGAGTVHGELLRFKDAMAGRILAFVDQLESCFPEDDQASLFTRETVAVTTASGDTEMAQTYFYNPANAYLPSPDALRRVESGLWMGNVDTPASAPSQLDGP